MKTNFHYDELIFKAQMRAIIDYGKFLENEHSIKDWDVSFVIMELRRIGRCFTNQGIIEE